MHFFISGGPIIDSFTPMEASLSEYRLFSVHDTYLKNLKRYIAMAPDFERRPKHIMLDSGAFTAWNKGKVVTVKEVISAYTEFFDAVERANIDFDSVVMINLDVIPGVKGRATTPDEMAYALKQSDINFEILNKHFPGQILPVAHQDEPASRIIEVSQQAEYVCLSPRNDVAEGRRTEWALWAHGMTKENRTHGLATTGVNMTYSSPWWSIDSASWVHLAIYGKIYIDMGTRYRMINISENSSFIDQRNEHFNTVSGLEQERIVQTIESCGYTIEECMTHFRPRSMVNIAVMAQQAERAKAHVRTKAAQGMLF